MGMEGSEQRGIQSETEQVPPESDKIDAFTARMYAIVRNVAVPARSSVVKVVFRSLSLNLFPTLLLPMNAFSRETAV